MAVAAGVTFYALLALFPALAALVSIYGLFADPATIQEHLNTLSGVLPGGALEVVGEQVKRIASKGGGALGFGFVFGLAVSLWSANAGMKAVFDALNIVYDEEEKRSFVRLNLQSPRLYARSHCLPDPRRRRHRGDPDRPQLSSASAVDWNGSSLSGAGRFFSSSWCSALPFSTATARAATPRSGAWVTPGSLVAAGLWLVASLLFSWYASNFGSYNETYGSLGAVIGFMTWIWLSAIVVLLGAEINAETEHQTAHDTTDGPPQPMGARGATMADTVGKAQS